MSSAARRTPLLLLAVAAALGLVPAGAGAATAEVQASAGGGFSLLRVAAAPGEANDLHVELRHLSATVTDAGAAIAPGAGCAASGAGAVTCTAGGYGFSGATVDLGDGADRAVLLAPVDAAVFDTMSFTVDGGAGDDNISGGPGRAQYELTGGPGADTLTGGEGDDRLVGGDGPDRLAAAGGVDLLQGDGPAAAPAPDRLDGGTGLDTVTYAERSTPVQVRLGDAGGQGGRDEGDRLQAVENVDGGSGRDVLVGDGGRNVFDGGKGRGGAGDVERGMGGPDQLHGTPGADVLDAGAGRDIILGAGRGDRVLGGAGRDDIASDGAHVDGGPGDDRVTAGGGAIGCGPGIDTVRPRGAAPLLRADCERAEYGEWGDVTFSVPRLLGGSVVTRVTCAAYFVNEEDMSGPNPDLCSGRLAIRAGRRRLGRVPFSADSGQSRRLAVHLTRPVRPGTRLRAVMSTDAFPTRPLVLAFVLR